jgi:hypothetical protein
MPLATGTTVIDFVILDLHDPNLLGIADKSYYPNPSSVVSPTVEITPPSFPKATLTYVIKTLNTYNSNDLKLTCTTDDSQLGNLPDGMYTIKMSVSPEYSYSKTKSFLRTTNIRRKCGIAVMKTDITCCSDDIKKQHLQYLDEINYYIECAIAAGNDCNGTVAMGLYQEANRMLDIFINNKPDYFLNPSYFLLGT